MVVKCLVACLKAPYGLEELPSATLPYVFGRFFIIWTSMFSGYHRSSFRRSGATQGRNSVGGLDAAGVSGVGLSLEIVSFLPLDIASMPSLKQGLSTRDMGTRDD